MRQIKHRTRILRDLQDLPESDTICIDNPLWLTPVDPDEDFSTRRLGQKHFPPVTQDLSFGPPQAKSLAALDAIAERHGFPVAALVEESVQTYMDGSAGLPVQG